jgi:DNA polymerase III alpha subunit
VAKSQMKISKCGLVGRTEEELIEIVRSNPEANIAITSIIGESKYNNSVKTLYSDFALLPQWNECEVEDSFHEQLQSVWLMPDEYKEINIVQLLINSCESEEELERVAQELLLYEEFNLMNLLRYLHYMVTTLKENNIVLGIGRGSSVSSFVLYKLGVHKINSLKWNLDYKDFLK